jgi:hypothetical protein
MPSLGSYQNLFSSHYGNQNHHTLDTVEHASHILCECEALDCLRLRHLGQYFTEPSDYSDVPTYKILRFIRSAGLLRG